MHEYVRAVFDADGYDFVVESGPTLLNQVSISCTCNVLYLIECLLHVTFIVLTLCVRVVLSFCDFMYHLVMWRMAVAN